MPSAVSVTSRRRFRDDRTTARATRWAEYWVFARRSAFTPTLAAASKNSVRVEPGEIRRQSTPVPRSSMRIPVENPVKADFVAE